jgi:hypothetical protein
MRLHSHGSLSSTGKSISSLTTRCFNCTHPGPLSPASVSQVRLNRDAPRMADPLGSALGPHRNPASKDRPGWMIFHRDS